MTTGAQWPMPMRFPKPRIRYLDRKRGSGSDHSPGFNIQSRGISLITADMGGLEIAAHPAAISVIFAAELRLEKAFLAEDDPMMDDDPGRGRRRHDRV